MSVVNVKVKYIRPDFENLQEWMNCKNHVYIGRKGIVFIDGKRFPSENSLFCNPYKIGKDGSREEVLVKYENYLVEKMEKDENFRKQFFKLRGKILGCWCKPESCHGDVILKLLK